jgi:signal peptidase I
MSEQLPPKKEDGFFKTAIIAILLALAIRTFLFEPFNIPSGSMKPTLQVGDYLFVNKYTYGYSKHSFPFSMGPFEGREFARAPERGDIIVFKLPTNTRVDYIKRVIGLPGDRIQVIDGRLYINRQIVEREVVGLRRIAEGYGKPAMMTEYIETLPDGTMHRILEEGDNRDLDNTDEYVVPEAHYFVMGDNRDNSQDSRVSSLVGYVPFENVVGRASFLFFSIDTMESSWVKPWTWPGAIRWDRLFDDLSPMRRSAQE